MHEELYSHIQAIEDTHWWYVARRKIIFDWVWQTLADYDAPRVLDVGCGTGFNLTQLRTGGCENIFGLDMSAQALGFCRSNQLTTTFCGDGTLLPLPSASFNVILALDLIEHLADDVQALKEWARVLKPGGSLLIFTPAFNFLWSLQDELGHHYRRYTKADLETKFARADLIPQKITYTNTFLFPMIWAGRMGLRLAGDRVQVTSENDLHPGWSNDLLRRIFEAERPWLRHVNFPFGVSLLAIARKDVSPQK